VTLVISAPETLDERGFDAVAAAWAAGEGGRMLLDARHVRWVSPFGILGLLAAGLAWQDRWGERPILQPPENKDVASYLSRIRFFERAHEMFDFEGHQRRRSVGESDALLEITPIRSHQDVHDVVDLVRDRAAAILGNRLGYPPAAVVHFSVILSEVCQNIVEHAEADGWVCAQTYNYKRRLGRQVVIIAVMDVGMGFRGSLAREHAQSFGERWTDETALEQAFLHGVSRYRDPGRGQGLQGIRRQVSKWDGLFTIRSGTAEIAEVPSWLKDRAALASGLPDFPGAQIQVVMPQVGPPAGESRGDRTRGGRGDA
jgi:anti-sigma regulatory factor (Ser/Thr protein kinase)